VDAAIHKALARAAEAGASVGTWRRRPSRRTTELMLVGAFACAHTPQLLARPETEDRALVLRVHAAFGRVRQRLVSLRPDVIAMIAGDHIEAFFLNAVPAFAVHVAAECAGVFGQYRYRVPIHEALARVIVEEGIERGFDLLYTQDAPLDYAFYVPLHFTRPTPTVPIVPLYVNVYLPPQPTPRRCYEWGRALGEILHRRRERIVLMASGGMSHFPGTDRYASPDFDYDRGVLEVLKQGRGAELSTLTAAELDKRGNIELRTWITLLGALGDARADVYCYEPSWHHGNAVVEWPAEAPGDHRANDPTTTVERSGDRGKPPPMDVAMGEGMHYAFSAARAYRLNRCLYAFKSDAVFRARYLADPTAALAEMGLSELERAALIAGDRNGLVALGAHPYLIFMADLQLRSERGELTFECF
jgi:2,3-dihydroxyphenylpropionate 1,2-dioxygenase